MQPRLSTSRQWTALPKELLVQVKSVFNQSFRESMGKGTFTVDGRIYKEEILIRVAFKQPPSLRHSGFNISMQYKRDKDNVVQLIHIGVDAAASLFEQFFASEDDSEFPRAWEEVDFEKRKIFVIYDTTNDELEAAADKILGKETVEKLAQGEWDDEEEVPKQLKAKLGLLDDDEDLPDDDDGEKH